MEGDGYRSIGWREGVSIGVGVSDIGVSVHGLGIYVGVADVSRLLCWSRRCVGGQ